MKNTMTATERLRYDYLKNLERHAVALREARIFELECEISELAEMPENQDTAKIAVTIDTRPWAGQKAKVAYEILRDKYDDRDIIALVLEERFPSSTQKDLSYLLMPRQDSDDSRVKQFRRMVNRARKRYKITYLD